MRVVGVGLAVMAVSNSRARALSFAGTSTTCSPSASSRCASGRPAPLLPSTAQVRSAYAATCLRIAEYPALSVPNLPVVNTLSRPSTTSIVADSCGDRPR
jgi:hypothetical protein